MKYSHTIFLSCVLLFLAENINAQSAPTYTPGSPLRVDFEGKHKIVDHRIRSSNSYQPGAILRIDFEGKHKIVNHRVSALPAYSPGPALRIDFQGSHRNRSTPINQ